MKKNKSTSRHMDWESIALPIILMMTGLILMGGDYFGVFSLDGIQNLWPVAVIVIGLTELVPFRDGKQS